MKPVYKSILFVVLIAITVGTLYWRVFGNEVPVPYRMDYVRFLTQQVRVVEDIRAGHFPLWNPYVLCGMPTLSNIMSNLFSPFLPIYFAVKDPVTAYVFVMLLELCILGWAYMFMMRTCFDIDRLSAYVGAVVFMLCGYSMWLLNASLRSMFQDPLFLFPAAVALYVNLRRKPSFGRFILLTLVLLVSYLNCNGNILHFGYNAVFLTAMDIFLFFFGETDIKTKLKTTVFLWSSIVVSLLLSAFQLLPFLEALSNSTRFSGEVVYTPQKLFPIAISFIYPDIWPKFIFINKIGGFYGLKYGVFGYCGIAAVILAMIGAVYHKDRTKRFFIFVPLAYLITWPIYTTDAVQAVLPTFIRSGNHIYYSAYLYAFCMAALAGLGFNVLRSQNIHETLRSRVWAYRFILFCALSLMLIYVCSAAGILAFNIFMDRLKPIISAKLMAILSSGEEFARSETFYRDKIDFIISTFKTNSQLFVASSLFKAAGAGCIILLICASRRKKRIVLYALAGCVALDLIATDYQYLEFYPRDYYYEQTDEVRYIESKAESELFRVGVVFEDSNLFWRENPDASFADFYDYSFNVKGALHENIINRFGIQKIGGFDGMCPYRQHSYFSHLDQIEGFGSHGIFLSKFDSLLLDLCNMRYVITRSEIDNPKIEKMFDGPRYTIYRNNNAMPRAYWVGTAQMVESDEAAIQQILSDNFDPKSSVVIVSNDKLLTPNQKSQSTESAIDINSYTPNKITISAQCEAGWIVLTDPYYPGWKATVDNQPVPIYPANGLFRAIMVPEGTHTIEFTYFPESMKKGVWIALASALSLLIAWIIARRY